MKWNEELRETIEKTSKHKDASPEHLKQLKELETQVSRSTKEADKQLHEMAEELPELVDPQIGIWQKWARHNQGRFKVYDRYWTTLHRKYKVTRTEVFQILGKYRWVVTPSLPVSLLYEVVKIGRRKGKHQERMINSLFTGHFTSNDFSRMEKLIDGWSENEYFIPRMKIFKDCLEVMRVSNETYNPSNLVVPTLLAQVDGIRNSFMMEKGVYFDIKKREWKDAGGKHIDRGALFKRVTSITELSDIANNAFLYVLFQEAYPGTSLKNPLSFDRYKILHGETLNYGKLTYAIQAFLILDFLATITG